ncbi:hypothetical protein KBZ10_11680 [Streptomyces sp. F63]|uniref:hypothetical protein n=1 Tax=Streptomyces sp. F63 TaxID=2824887 RepID=UPI001B35AA41|nr:hypothetical protein [Streptomyces sp. F63]MBQ0985170.1 hypothetical protein [Streptomyces sp. F63]
MTADRSLTRLLRAALFAAVSVVLAATGHAVMSGHDIPLPALLAAIGITGTVAWLAGGRRRGVLSIAGTLLAVQAVLHLIFTDGPGTPAAHRRTPVGTLPEAGAGASGTGNDGGAAGQFTGLAAPGEHSEHATLAMLAAHLLAALCCAVWLWRGEAVFFRLLRCLGSLALMPLRTLLRAARYGTPAAPRPVRPPLPYGEAALRLRGALLAHVLSRRGPPPRTRPRPHPTPYAVRAALGGTPA